LASAAFLGAAAGLAAATFLGAAAGLTAAVFVGAAAGLVAAFWAVVVLLASAMMASFLDGFKNRRNIT
jgi:hypothetical protein